MTRSSSRNTRWWASSRAWTSTRRTWTGLTRKVSQVKDDSWDVLFYDTHMAAQVTVPADEGCLPHVLLLNCHHGIGGQRDNH